MTRVKVIKWLFILLIVSLVGLPLIEYRIPKDELENRKVIRQKIVWKELKSYLLGEEGVDFIATSYKYCISGRTEQRRTVVKVAGRNQDLNYICDLENEILYIWTFVYDPPEKIEITRELIAAYLEYRIVYVSINRFDSTLYVTHPTEGLVLKSNE